MNIQPLGERVLLKRSPKEEKTKGGIYIPESSNSEQKEGTVYAIGTGKDGKPLPLAKGDKVLYGGYSSDKVEIEGDEFIFVDFKDILAKLS